jgi:acyl dehydratase
MNRFNEINLNDSVEIQKSFSQEEVDYYTRRLSIDNNPIHYDANYAKTTFFGVCIVPGILVSSLFGGLLGSRLPGHGTIHLGQTCRFLKPVFIGEMVIAKIKVISKRDDKNIITLNTQIVKVTGEIAIDGEAVIKLY